MELVMGKDLHAHFRKNSRYRQKENFFAMSFV